MNPPTPSADHLLREYHRWARASWPLGIAAAGLAATLALGWRQHPSPARIENWGSLPAWWLGGGALTLAAVAAAWLWTRRNLLHSAQLLDERLAAKSRLETAAALNHDSGPLACAQREETRAFLDRTAARPRPTPLLALGALVSLLLLSHLATLLTWTRPWFHPAEQAAPKPSPAPAALPKASIKWKSPAVETKAAPIEEVPLEATAESTGGLRDLVLEMEVNGEPRLQAPVPLDELKAPGRHAIQTSIYLDQLNVQPYDIVSYHLRAQRIDPRQLPETDSPVQFVQIKPFRDDVREMAAQPGDAKPELALITALKGAQLRLIKENFLLAHTDLAHDSADWQKENGRVGHEQGVLAEKTGEAVQKLIDAGAPAEIVDLITQARPLMEDAAKHIQTAVNQPALAPQGKALGLITAVEKFLIKVAAQSAGSPPKGGPNVDDPFRDRKQFELKQRFATKAGELELLAKEQARLADDLAKGDPSPAPPQPDAKPDPNRIEGTAAERQTQISQRVGALLNGRLFVPEATQHLETGRDLAREALRQLDAADVPASREPAAAAARELQLAAAAVNKAGEEQAKDELADTLRALNRAAGEARSAPQQNSEAAARQAAEEARRQAQDAARQLARDARQQQETDPEKAAARLSDLAKGLSADDLQKALDRLRAQPRDAAAAHDAADRLEALAARAALPPEAGSLSPDEVAALIARLERDHANLERLAMNTSPAAPGPPRAASPTGQPEPNPAEGQQSKPTQGDQGQGQQPGERAGQQPGKGEGQQPAERAGQQPGRGQGQQPGERPGQQPGKGQGQQPGERAGQQPGKGQGQQPGERAGQQPGKGEGQQPGEGAGQQPGKGEGQQPGEGAGQQPGKGQGQQPGEGAPGQPGAPAQAAAPGTQPGSGEGSQPGEGAGMGDATRPGKGGSGKGERDEQAGQPGRATGTQDRHITDPNGGVAGPLQFGPTPGDGQEAGPIPYGSHPVVHYLPGSEEAKEKFAHELVEDLHEAAQTAAPALPRSTELAQVRQAIEDLSGPDLHNLAPLLGRIDPPLEGVIRLLQAQLGTARRQYQLADQHLDLAPPVYRAAVADYFEQLSREDEPAPPEPARQ